MLQTRGGYEESGKIMTPKMGRQYNLDLKRKEKKEDYQKPEREDERKTRNRFRHLMRGQDGDPEF